MRVVECELRSTTSTSTDALSTSDLDCVGPIAQRLEPPAHNRPVPGSNPGGPTTFARRCTRDGWQPTLRCAQGGRPLAASSGRKPIETSSRRREREREPACRLAKPRCASAGAFFVSARCMNADLERLIALQRLDSAAHDAERRLAEEPEREKALDARLEAARQRVAAAKERLAENQNARRAIEKDVAVHQGRLSKFRDQAMAVKTNSGVSRRSRTKSRSRRPRSRRSKTRCSSGCSRPTS